LTKESSIEIKILEAYTRDVGRGHIRIDYDTMEKIGCKTDDFVEITGKEKTTIAKVLPLYPSDEKKGIGRADGLIRTNAGISIGDEISIRKIKAEIAKTIDIAPLEAVPPIDERYLSDALESVGIKQGDKIMIPYFGGRISFQVLKTDPCEFVVVGNKTIFRVMEKMSLAEIELQPLYKKLDEKKKELMKEAKEAIKNISDIDKLIEELDRYANSISHIESIKEVAYEIIKSGKETT